MCANLKYPNTIIEFPPKGKPVKTDSPLLYAAQPPFGLHPPCRILRKRAGKKWCYECDCAHALLLRGLNRSNLATEVRKRIEESKYIRKYRLSDPAINIDLKEKKGRAYLEYDCPLLGSRELMFPVLFESNVVGVFFTGQICLEWKENFFFKRIKEFFEKNGDRIIEKSKENDCRKLEDIQEKIIDAHRDWVNDRANVLDRREYVKLVGKTCGELERLERTLVDQMSLQRIKYVRRYMDTRIKKFRENGPSQELSSNEKWDALWRVTEEQIDKLCKDFAIRYIVIFATRGLEKGKASLLHIVAKAGVFPEELKDPIRSGQLRVTLDKLPKNVQHEWLTSVENDGVFNTLDGFPGEPSRRTNLMRVFPVPLLPRASLSVLVGYRDDNPLQSEENRPGGHLSVALQSFYTVVLSSLSSVLAGDAESKMRAAMQHLKAKGEHEKAFLLRAAHSISLPITSIGADCANLLDEIDPDDPIHEITTHMFDEVQGLQLFIQNVLHMEYKETTESHEPEFYNRSLFTLLKEACNMCAGEAADKGCDILPVIVADGTEIKMDLKDLDDLELFHMRALYDPMKDKLGISRDEVVWSFGIQTSITVKGKKMFVAPKLLPKMCFDKLPASACIEIQGQKIDVNPKTVARLYLPYVGMVYHELALAFKNLVHNAVKYSYRTALSSKKRYVKVAIQLKDKKSYKVSISNYGVGILEHEINEGLIWQGGYRGKLSIDRNRPGAGLGLSQAKHVIEDIHGGKLQVTSSLQHTNVYLTTFVTTVPTSQKYRIC